jgi:hypothetical protein
MANGSNGGASLKISIILEGGTERAFLPYLRTYLQSRLAGQMPKLDPIPCDGLLPTGDKLKRIVHHLLNSGQQPSGAVIALTDVYTGLQPRRFTDAADAKAKLRQWVGSNPRFFPHAAQYEFEAWLLPYWNEIQRLSKSNHSSPGQNPESINHDNPPAKRIQEVFRSGGLGKSYVKQRDAGRILRNQDLTLAISACPELKAFVNTIFLLCGADPIH